ncbi:MAG TPA: PAS domain S-box protein, partial [Bacteroidales bacterium]|nr:PAS domain S-box protein [Bacteroidales bacterium]
MAASLSDKNIADVFHNLGKAWAMHDVVRDQNGSIVNYKLIDANPLFEKILGIPVEKARDRLATDIYDVDNPPFLEPYASVVESGQVVALDSYYQPMDMHFHIQVYKPRKNSFVTVFENITRQKELERGHKHQDAVFKLMQHLNKLLWEIDDNTKIASIIAKGVQDYPEAYDSAWIALFDNEKHVSQFASFNLRNADAFEEKIRNGNFPEQFNEALNKPEGMYTRLPEEPCEDCILSDEHAENAVFVKALFYGNKIFGVIAVSLDEHFVRIDNEKERFNEFADDISFFLDAIYSKLQLENVKNDLDTTLYSIGDAVISTDVKGNVARMNPVAQNLCGMDIAEARGKPLTEVFRIVNAFTRKPVDNPVDKVLETGEIVGLANHTLLLSHDDAEYQIADSAAPIRNADNELLGIVLVFRDVSKAYEQQENLRQSEVLYRAVFENTGTATCTYGDDGIITRCNEKFEELAALPSEKIEGKLRWSDFVAKEDIERMSGYHQKRTEGEFVRVDHEFRFVDATGVEKDVLVRVGMESDSSIRVASLLDITERNRLSRELKESEEKFRKMAENSATAIMMHQNDYWIYANPAAETLSGYSIPELLTMKFWEFTHPDSTKAVKKAGRARSSDEGANMRYELKIITKQGKTRWMDLSGSTIMYNGKPAGLVTVYDITARKKAEAEVEAKLHEMERLADNLPSVIWKAEVTPDGDFVNTYIANTVNDLLNLPANSIKNNWQKFFSYITPDHMPEVKQAFEDGIANPGKKISREYRVVKADGEKAWFRSYGKTYAENGKMYVFGNTEDVTKRNKDRQRLKNRSAAINSAIDGIALLNEKGEYTFMNQAHAEIYGYKTPAELIGKTWELLYNGDELSRFQNKIMPEFERKGDWRGEANGTKKDGSTFPQEVSLTALDNGGLICIVRDITKRKETENALRKAKEK